VYEFVLLMERQQEQQQQQQQGQQQQQQQPLQNLINFSMPQENRYCTKTFIKIL
jgi:hypothetical protein